MQKRHQERDLYFKEQGYSTGKYILPYISDFITINEDSRVLEVGCGDGGNLTPFLDLGADCVGIDAADFQIDTAKEIYSKLDYKKIKIIHESILNVGIDEIGKFDFIFMKDVIEHISDRQALLEHLRTLLSDKGIIFFAFPPWRMPFGGHQQGLSNKFLSNTPWIHLVGKKVFLKLMKHFGETEHNQHEIGDVFDCQLSLIELNKRIRQTGFKYIKRDLYFINPNYEIKFGLKPIRLPKLFHIPWLCDFYTTCCYAVLMDENRDS